MFHVGDILEQCSRLYIRSCSPCGSARVLTSLPGTVSRTRITFFNRIFDQNAYWYMKLPYIPVVAVSLM